MDVALVALALALLPVGPATVIWAAVVGATVVRAALAERLGASLEVAHAEVEREPVEELQQVRAPARVRGTRVLIVV